MDVQANPFQIFIVAYDVIVETTLPGELRVEFLNAPCTCALKLVDDRPKAIFLPMILLCKIVYVDSIVIVDGKNAMEMIGHHAILIEFNVFPEGRDSLPFLFHDLAQVVEVHTPFPIDSAKTRKMFPRADRHGIPSASSIIPRTVAQGARSEF